MPEAVQAFCSTASVQEAFAVHRELCEAYRQDFSRYAPRADPRCLDEVLQSVARCVGGQIHYTNLAQGFSGPTAKSAFELLCKARVVRKVPSTNPSGLPLAAGARARPFKATLLDIGLWQHLSGMQVAAEYSRDDLLSVYRGAMAEQFVGQELAVTQAGGLFYWARDARGSTSEVDYLAVVDGLVHGVEVKSGAAGSLKSLHLLLGSYPGLGRGLVLQARPYAELPGQRLVFLPLYFAYSATGGGWGG
jgi:predicted AAA+ superfamily ATPase